MPEFHDKVFFDKARKTKDGFLVVDARVARTGIQEYLGSELGLLDRDVVRVYRPEEEVFSSDAMHTYAHRPVTMGHPPEMVDASNWKKYAAGQTGGEVTRDGNFVRVPMVLMDSDAISAVNDGIREISMGYTANIELMDGVTPEGEKYDAIQTGLRMNHLAVVASARGGSNLNIGDNQGEELMADPIKTRTVVVDGLSIETTDQGAQALEKLQKQLADSAKTHATEIADKEKEIAKLEAERDDAKSKILSDADLEKRIMDRSRLVEDARRVAGKDIDVSGKTDHEVRVAAIAARDSEIDLEGKSEAYVEARFDVMVDSDPLSRSVKPGGDIRQTQQDSGVFDWDKAASRAGVKMKEAN